MQFIIHFYIIEAILAITLIGLSFLLFMVSKSSTDNLSTSISSSNSNIKLKYRELRKKHFALHSTLDKIIVDKINLKSELKQLTSNNLALKNEKESLEKKYNTVMQSIDTNIYKNNQWRYLNKSRKQTIDY